MADAKPIAPIRIGGTDIHYAQGMRAGPWLFFTGHEASDFERGIATVVAGKPGLPLDGQARYRREADYVLARLAKLIAAEGGDLRHIVRVDQYYPSALAVNPYQRARKALLKDYVPPSTSVLMEELLVIGANVDLSMLAVLPGEGREPQPARAGGVPVPQHSGFIPSLVCGDYVFVAGQMPNNEAMTALEPAAYRAPNAVWNGTDIRLQSEFIITGRLKPALEAGGSSLANAIKAQVYLTDINDLPEFMDVWNGYFGANLCAMGERSARRSSSTSPRRRCGSDPRRCARATSCAFPRSMPPTRTARCLARRRACAISARRCSTRCAPCSTQPTRSHAPGEARSPTSCARTISSAT